MNKELQDLEKFEEFREEYKKNNFIYRCVWKYDSWQSGFIFSFLVFLIDFIITYFIDYSYIYLVFSLTVAFIIGFYINVYARHNYIKSQKNYFKKNG